MSFQYLDFPIDRKSDMAHLFPLWVCGVVVEEFDDLKKQAMRKKVIQTQLSEAVVADGS